MRAEPELSLLIVNYNSWRYSADAVESFARHAPRTRDGSPMPYEIVVVDNCSPVRDAGQEKRLRERLAETNGRLIMHDENGGYAKGMNLAYQHARGSWILISNPDVVFVPGCVERLLRHMEDHPDVGAAAPEGYLDLGLRCRLPPNILPTLRDLVGTTLVGISRRGMKRYSRKRTAAAVRVWTATEPIDLTMLSGCLFLMRRSLIEEIGFFDPRFPLYYEDTDLSMRIRRAGRRIVQVTGAKLVHLYDRSGQTDHAAAMGRYWISRRAYYRKWYGALGGWLFDLTRWVLARRWAQERAARPMHPDLVDLGASLEGPTIRLPRRMRFVVEISLDPRFYLAAGVLGDGEEWTPAPSILDSLGPTTYYFRVCDLDRDAEPVGIYRYQRLYPQEWLAKTAESAAAEPR